MGLLDKIFDNDGDKLKQRLADKELPEEVHTGSPREAFCPRATADSRPPG